MFCIRSFLKKCVSEFYLFLNDLWRRDGWMTCDYTPFFNNIQVISGRWADDNESLCATEPRLRLGRFSLVQGKINRPALKPLSYRGSYGECYAMQDMFFIIICLFIFFRRGWGRGYFSLYRTVFQREEEGNWEMIDERKKLSKIIPTPSYYKHRPLPDYHLN